MAENKQEKRTFKWGDREYLLDDLLAQHAQFENNYYDFARDRGQYDATALLGLRQAITNRINAVKDGKSFDGDGTLYTDKVDNTRILTLKKGLFKKDKYVDQDNTEWAKYYLNQLVGRIKPYERPTTSDKGSWDISKHGLSAYLTVQGLNARDIFEKYDLRDQDNPEAARAFTLRRELLKKHLAGYNNWLKGKGFDFSKNDNEWDDTFGTDLDKFVTDYDTLDNNALAAQLRRFGAGDDYTTAFTSDRWDLSKTNAQSEADIQKTKEELENKLKNERLKTAQDEFLNNFVNDKGNYYTPLDYSSYKFRDGVTKSFMNYYSDLNPQQLQNHGTYLGTDNQVWANAWNKLMDSLKTGVEYSDKNKGILLQRYFEDAPNGFTDLGNGTYLINESINDKGTGYVYDPKSGFLQRRHISEFANQNDSIKKAYEDILYRHINNKYGTNYNNREYIAFENGGIIKALLGAAVLKPYNVNTQYKEEANVKGISEKTQKAKNQYIDSDNKSEANPNAGLTTGLKARIAYAIADLGSATAAFFGPAGTAVSAGLGLGSTIGNFISDAGDDAVTAGEMWKNLGMNLGIDALGLIPGGGAASKMGKIVRGLKTVVPALIALPGVSSMLTNSPEIAQSWKKAFDGDPENGGSKMNYQDYLNILLVLNVAAGGTNIARNTYKSAKASTKLLDKIAVDVIDNQTKTRKALMLEGDDVTKFKEAQAQGKAQEFINKIEGDNNYTINETTKFNKGKFWGKGSDDKFHLFNLHPLGSTSTGKANILQIKQDNRTGKLYADTGWRGGDDLLDQNLINSSAYRKELQSLRDPLLAQAKKVLEEMTIREGRLAKANTAFEAKKERLEELNNKLKGVTDKDVLSSTNRNKKENLEKVDASIQSKEKSVKNAKKHWEKLKNKRVSKKNLSLHKADVKQALGTFYGETSALSGLLSKKLQINDQVERVNIERLKNIKDSLGRNNHTNAYNKLQQMVANLQANNSRISGRQVTWDMDEILRNAGIKDAFKEGGSINRNKINKFLNYAKG